MSILGTALKRAHDQHSAHIRSAAGIAATKAAYRQRQAAKAALRADPAARAAQLADINGLIIQRRRLASVQTLALDLAAKHNTTPAKVMWLASLEIANIERNAALRAAAKRQRAGRVYPSDGWLARHSRQQVPVAVEVAA